MDKKSKAVIYMIISSLGFSVMGAFAGVLLIIKPRFDIQVIPGLIGMFIFMKSNIK